MAKKILMGLAAVLVVAGGVAALSAYEAHIINVTAHIENALTTHGDPLSFGTVFPQEYLTKNFTVTLSDSFISSGRTDFVRYEIVQKPKCQCNLWNPENTEEENKRLCPDGRYLPVGYSTHTCPSGYTAMNDLCEFLSKLPAATTPDGEVGVPSYFQGTTCATPVPDIATGSLQGGKDASDEWIVDLKVPPVKGYIGQDWPATCADWTVPTDGADYGCDLWLEVTCIGNKALCFPAI